MFKVTITYLQGKVQFNVRPYDRFEKYFDKFCQRFNKFIEGSGLIDASIYFGLDNPYYVSTKNVISISYEYVEQKAAGRKKKEKISDDSK